jgi:hypothetical protein
MAADLLKHTLEAWGPSGMRVAHVRWTPSASATQTLTEAHGVLTVTRSGAGAYVVNLREPCKSLVAIVQVVENDTTLYHVARVESSSASAGTVTLSHKSVAFASVASGPTASDTVDELQVIILQRMHN